MTKVHLVGVTDAKDCHDRLTSDTGFGTQSQKSLSFTLATSSATTSTKHRIQVDGNHEHVSGQLSPTLNYQDLEGEEGK